MNILALDPGTLTGWAHSDGRSGSVALWREPKKGRPAREAVYYKAGPKKGQLRLPAISAEPAIDDGPRDTRLQRLYTWLELDAFDVDVVVIEGLDSGWTKGRNSAAAARVAAELRAIVKLWCLNHGRRLEELRPQDVKAFATGKGNAKKEEVFAAARHKLGYQGDSEDEADALWILKWAREHVLPAEPSTRKEIIG